MKAVRFDEYGGVDVLKVVDVPTPEPGPGQVLVQVKAAGINPGEAKIRDGLLHARWPATFPSGQGSDLAGVVAETGPGVTGFAVGDEVIGYTDDRASQAEYVVVEEQNLTARPAGVPWEVAGALFVAGATAYRRGPGRGADRGRHRGRLGRGRRGRLDRRPAGPAGRRHRDRAGQPGEPRVAGRARRDPGGLRRRRGRPDPAGRGQGRRVHRHVRRRATCGWRSSSVSSRPGSTPSPISTRSPSTASRPRATRPAPARPTLAELAGLIAERPARGADRRDVPAQRGPGRVPAAGERPHPREDRPDDLTA